MSRSGENRHHVEQDRTQKAHRDLKLGLNPADPSEIYPGFITPLDKPGTPPGEPGMEDDLEEFQ